MMNSYARYGIWGENPNGTSVVDTAFNTNKAINDLFTQKNNLAMGQMLNQQMQQNLNLGNLGYQQKQMEVNNLPFQQDIANKMSQIGLDSAQSNFNYTPQQRAIAEQAARDKSNLENSQAGYYKAQSGVDAAKDPAAYFQNLLDKYNSAPQGSSQKIFFGHLLGNMSGDDGGVMSMAMPGGTKGAAGVNMAMGGAGGSTGAGGALNVPRIGPDGMIINPGTVSSKSNRGMQYAGIDSNGNPATYSSPTMANTTANNNRIASEQEARVFAEPVLSGVQPYQGAYFGPNSQIIKDDVLSYFGNQNAKTRLDNLAFALKSAPEAAGMIGRMTKGGEVGEGVLNQLQDSLKQGTPSEFFLKHGIPQSSLKYASDKYLDLQNKAVEAAVNAERNNYKINSSGLPDYAQTQPKKLSSFVRNAMTPEQIAQYEAQQAQNNPKQPPTQNSNIPDDDTIKSIAANNNIAIEDVLKRAKALFGNNK